MKKTLLIFLVAMIALSAVFAGGSSESSAAAPAAEKKNEITVVYLDEKPWHDQADEFTAATGIKVNYINVPFPELRQRSLTSFLSQDSHFDVIHLRSDYVYEFASKEFLEPLDDLLTAEEKAAYNKTSLDNLSFGGHLYGLPRYYWLWQFNYNTQILKEAGVEKIPETWDELIAITPQIKAAGHEVMIAGLDDEIITYMFYVLLNCEGTTLIDEKGMPVCNNEAGARALDTLKRLVDSEAISKHSFEIHGSNPASDMFCQGDFAFCFASPATYSLAMNPASSRIVGMVETAVVPKGSVGSASWNEPAGLGIPYNAPNKEGAIEYIKFCTTPEQQKKVAMQICRVSTHPEVNSDPEILAKYPQFSSINDQLEYPSGIVNSIHAMEVLDTTAELLHKHLDGTLNTADTLKAIEKALTEIAQQ